MAEEESLSLRTEVEGRGEKERLWSSELTQLTSDLQLSRERVGRLEREGAGLKAELARVAQLLEDARREVCIMNALCLYTHNSITYTHFIHLSFLMLILLEVRFMCVFVKLVIPM